MGWKFWRREPSEAERSLAALQAQQAAPAPPAPPPAPEPPMDPQQAEAMEHMRRVTAELEALIADDVPVAERGTFMLEVTSVEPGPDGTLVLGGGAYEGSVAPGQLVGLLVLPRGLAHADPSLSEAEGERQLVEALLGARAVRATVVDWDDAGPRLVVSGPGLGEVTVGAMVTR